MAVKHIGQHFMIDIDYITALGCWPWQDISSHSTDGATFAVRAPSGKSVRFTASALLLVSQNQDVLAL